MKYIGIKESGLVMKRSEILYIEFSGTTHIHLSGCISLATECSRERLEKVIPEFISLPEFLVNPESVLFLEGSEDGTDIYLTGNGTIFTVLPLDEVSAKLS